MKCGFNVVQVAWAELDSCWTDLLVDLRLGGAPATVQADVDDGPAQVLVPGHHVHPVAQLCHTHTQSKTQL